MYPMKRKEGMFKDTSSVSTHDYRYWKNYLEGSRASSWVKLNERFAEDYQFALLRAITIVGIAETLWNSVFDDVYKEKEPFEGLCKLHFEGQLKPDWHFFAKQLALETYRPSYYPARYPEWLLMFGYNHRQYLQDLEVYWDAIHPKYYQPWPGNRLGIDSPEVARLKKLGDLARDEITKIAEHGSKLGK
jgi:hypothetical protein